MTRLSVVWELEYDQSKYHKYSDNFKWGGEEGYLKVYFNGDKIDNRGYFSIFFGMKAAESNRELEVWKKITLHNYESPDSHVSHESTKFYHSGTQATWGWSKFAPIAPKKGRFINSNNKIKILLEAEIKSVKYPNLSSQ